MRAVYDVVESSMHGRTCRINELTGFVLYGQTNSSNMSQCLFYMYNYKL